MFKKQLLLSTLAVGFVINNAVAMHQPQPKVFDKTDDTRVLGNPLFLWFATDAQLNPSPEFEKTRVVAFLGNDTYSEEISLRDLKEYRYKQNYSIYRANETFNKHVKANNAIVCPDFTQLPNKDGELKAVAAIIYGTQKTSHCERYKQWLQNKKTVNNANNDVVPTINDESTGGAFGGFFNSFYKLLDEKNVIKQ